MNRDDAVISRALQLIGQEPLNEEDKVKNTTRWRAVKEFYLPVVLSVYSSAEWTELKTRKKLIRKRSEPTADGTHEFFLPDDCARAIELISGNDYEINGRTLYTDDAEPVLLYVSNGRRVPIDWHLARENRTTGRAYGGAYHNGHHYQMYVNGPMVVWIDSTEDYPEYRTLEWSPELTDCVTATLASEIALKISADKQLYSMLIQMASAAMDAGARISRTKGASRTSPSAFWGDALGIPSRSRRT